MLRKLSFILIIAISLWGCGASAPAELAADAAEASSLNRWDTAGQKPAGPAYYGESVTEAPAQTEKMDICQAEYFRFTRATNTVSDSEGRDILYENYCVADFTSSDPEREAWVEELLTGISRDYSTNSANLHQYAEEFLDLNSDEFFYSYSNYQQLGVARHDETVVSLIELSSLYSGGSHPNAVQTAYNLDIEGKRLLRLEDVIAEACADDLAGLVRAEVDEKFTLLDGGNDLFGDYGDTIDNSMVYGSMTPYWYLNDTGLVIFYNQYELGPYAAGIIKVELPYGDLEGILTEEFFPALSDNASGDLLLRGDWEGWHRIPITIESDGETLLVGVEGTVRQVQLSEVFWLEDTPIAQELLYSARTMCQNDVLEITGGFDDDTRSFAIEFLNGRGEQMIYYLHVGELTEEP